MTAKNNAKLSLFTLAILLSGCATNPPPPQWNPVTALAEAEYQPYLVPGSGTLVGQASIENRIGSQIPASGRTVTLDPATSVGTEWWQKTSTVWANRSLVPPSPGFSKGRRIAVADEKGNFKFAGLPPGKYYVRTEITWKVGNYGSVQGGLVGQMVTIHEGQTTQVTLDQMLK